MATILIIARLFHIGGGIFWVGAVLTAVFFLEPTAKAMGADGSAFMGHLIRRRRLTSVMGAVAIMSIGAGAVLYWVISGGLRAAWLTSGPGMAYGVGGAAALVAFLIALVLLKPGYDRIAAIAEEAAMSRVYAGVHYRFDGDAGLATGLATARLALRRGLE